MHLAKRPPRGRSITRRHSVIALLAVPLLLGSSAPVAREASSPSGETVVTGAPAVVVASAVVNFADLARREALGVATVPPIRVLLFPEYEDPPEPPAPTSTNSLQSLTPPDFRPGFPTAFVASPSPTNNYMGLDDIPMVDSSYIVIPPDIAGGVGPAKVMESFNNNYRIRDKATGAIQLTVGTATFWNPVVTNKALLNGLTDPRTVYDPYQNRWLVAMQTTNNPGLILFGVSFGSDPAGGWYLYAVSPGFTTSPLLDFPILGFNKNWLCVTINAYTSGGAFSRGGTMIANYLQAAAGTLGSVTTVSHVSGTHFSTSPCVTLSATEDTLFLVTHLSSGGATYMVDRITGTPAAPTYTVGGTNTRPGGGWTQPSGNILPQSAPVAGASVCAPPCKIETQDAQVRSSPVYRNGFIYYSQTIGLPAVTLTRTVVQWTKITPSTTPAFADGGRIDDPTATATNGGKWYAYPSLSVNSTNDVMIGYTQFSSAQHPSAGYSMRLGGDALGTLRDPLIYHAGEDYYHKTFTTATGRNRWGDFSTTQVDPCDDQTLWTLQEYAKTRPGTNDGNTGSNSSKWSSWWAAVSGLAPVAGVTCPADTIGSPGSAVSRKFRITNIGTASGTFSYSITDVAGWGGPASGTTPPLAPSSFFDVFVSFSIPSNCVPVSDLVTLSAQTVGPANCYSPVSCTTKVLCDLATPTLVSRFDATLAPEGVDLSWWSDAVGQVEGWNVYRARSENGGWARVNPSPIAMSSGGAFRLHDGDANSGDVFYRLNALLPGGSEEVLSNTRVAVGGQAFSFAIVGGNPFSGRTTLRYTVPRAEHVRVDVYSVTGARLRTLVDRMETPGVHEVDFALRGGGRTLAPGIYMVRITAGSERKTLRVVGME